MDVLTRSEIQKLANIKQNPAISIVIPTGTSDFGVLRSRFRQKLIEARDAITLENNDQSLKHTALYAGYELLHDKEWWLKSDRSAVIYLAKGFIKAYHLADYNKAQISIGNEFNIVPLLDAVSDDEFHILALSQKKVKLLWSNRHVVEEIKLDDMPRAVSELVASNEVLKNSKRPDIFHFLRSIDNTITPHLNLTKKPLVLVGLPHIAALYQGMSSYEQTMRKYVAKSPDGMTDIILRDRAWAALKPHARRDQRISYSRFDRLIRTQPQKTARGIRQVMGAIAEGRVQTLFINPNMERWGSLSAVKTVDLHDDPKEGDVNLLNMLASSAIAMGQNVFSFPEGSPELETAAILRPR